MTDLDKLITWLSVCLMDAHGRIGRLTQRQNEMTSKLDGYQREIQNYQDELVKTLKDLGEKNQKIQDDSLKLRHVRNQLRDIYLNAEVTAHLQESSGALESSEDQFARQVLDTLHDFGDQLARERADVDDAYIEGEPEFWSSG